jgi:hypothetical protein
MPFSARIGFYQDQVVSAVVELPDWPSVPTQTEYNDEVSTWSQSATETASLINLGVGTVRHRGATAHPNGNIYMIPRFVDHFVEIDPVNNVYNEGHTISGWANNDYTTGVTAQNGNIYCMPFNTGAYIGEYDPVANTFTKISITSGWPSGTTSYYSCTLMNNGDIFMMSRLNGKPHLRYTPGTTSVTQLGLSPAVDFAQSGACTDFTGNVWLGPYRTSNVYKYDPVANTFTSIGSIAGGGDRYAGIHTGADGNVWGIPHSVTQILKVDTSNDTFTEDTFGASLTGSSKYIGGTLGNDGAIYATPFNSGDVLRIDTLANTASRSNYGLTIPTVFGISAGQSKGDHIYFCRDNNSSVLVIDTKANGGSSANSMFTYQLTPAAAGAH